MAKFRAVQAATVFQFSSSARRAEESSMAIKVGDKLPEATFMTMSADGPKPMTTAEVFGGKKVALFAVPGAYTPTCHKTHMPGFVERAEELRKKGFDAVACTAVNDVFVLTNWGKDSKADGKIQMLADGSADFAKKIGLDIDLTARGLGVRSKRYAMAVEDGVVKILNIEDAPPTVDKSSAATLCSMVDKSL
jgi:glutaredoxin/glutathione-dependent peroxiredoxin